MAEGRMLKRKVSQSRKVNSLSLKAALLWTWAIPWFDGYGFIEAEPDYLKLNVVPRRNDISEEDMPGLLRELSRSKLWIIYKDKESGKLIAHDPKFKEEQRLRMEREGKQRFTPGELQDYSGSTPAEDKINEVKLIKERPDDPSFSDFDPKPGIKKKDSPSASVEEEKTKSEIVLICDRLYRNGKFPKSPTFVNFVAKKGCHPGAVLQCLQSISDHNPLARGKDPWAYGIEILKVENGNFNERDAVHAHEQNKKLFTGIVDDLKQLHEQKRG